MDVPDNSLEVAAKAASEAGEGDPWLLAALLYAGAVEQIYGTRQHLFEDLSRHWTRGKSTHEYVLQDSTRPDWLADILRSAGILGEEGCGKENPVDLATNRLFSPPAGQEWLHAPEALRMLELADAISTQCPTWDATERFRFAFALTEVIGPWLRGYLAARLTRARYQPFTVALGERNLVLLLRNTQSVKNPGGAGYLTEDMAGSCEYGVMPRHEQFLPGDILVVPAKKDLIERTVTLAPFGALAKALSAIPRETGLRLGLFSWPFAVNKSDISQSTDGTHTFLFSSTPTWESDASPRLAESIELCNIHQIHLAMFPELAFSKKLNDEFMAQTEGKEYPLVAVSGSWHDLESKEGPRNSCEFRIKGNGGLGWLLTHNKASVFRHTELGTEGILPGPGLSYIVTPFGVLALGICKDWFFQHDGDAGQERLKELRRMCPTAALCPAMSPDTDGLRTDIDAVYNKYGCLFLFCNANAAMKNLQNRATCLKSAGNPSSKTRGNDIRSFVAYPPRMAQHIPLAGSVDLDEDLHARIVRPVCGTTKPKGSCNQSCSSFMLAIIPNDPTQENKKNASEPDVPKGSPEKS